MALVAELHEVYVSPHICQVLAVVTALSMLYKVMDHMWDPVEVAKWSLLLVVKYVPLSHADASGRSWRAKP